MYTIYVKFNCIEGRREAFVERVKAEGILSEIKAEEGFIKYDYYFSESDPQELLLVEQWASYEHQQAHIAQPHMAKLRALKDDYILTTELREIELK